MKACARTPVVLTIAGSDSSGGAGIQADLKTFAAFGVYGASVITALTAQNTRGVQGIHPVPPAFIALQANSVASDLAIAATKTGMLGDTATVRAVAEAVTRHGLHPLVVDPVMVATSGDLLLAADAVSAVCNVLLPLADLVTPNLHEAARLTAGAVAANFDEMEMQARSIAALGPRAVLIKGGHGIGSEAVDILLQGGQSLHLARPRLDVPNTHGTGCTLAAAITALLAVGVPVAEAVTRAKHYVWQALAAGKSLHIGDGNGPVDHLFALRKAEPPA